MDYGLRSILMALVLILLASLLPSEANAVQIPLSEVKITTPKSVGPKYYKYEAWPVAVTASNGWIVMIHSSTDSHGSPTVRKVVVRVSKDKGLTWQTTKKIGTPNLTGQGSLVRLPSGRLILGVSDLDGHDNSNWTQFMKSDDHGLTWQWYSQRYPWTDVWSYGNAELLKCNNKLIIPWNGGSQWGMLTSADNGLTWSRSYKTASHMLYEGRITQAGGSNLLMLGRNRELGLTLFKSTDCGETWTSQLTGLGGGTKGWLTEGAVRHGDTWRLLTIDRISHKMELRNGSVTKLLVDPKAWSSPKLLRQLQPSGVVDKGYPTIISASRTFDFLAWYGPTAEPKAPMIYSSRVPWQTT